MSGAGNDFLVLDNRFYAFTADELSSIARRFCRRRISIGADGILALSNASVPDADIRMLYFNADGSRGTMCGNGARCLIAYAFEAGIGASGRISMQTDADIYVGSRVGDDIKISLPPDANYKQDVVVENAEYTFDYIWTGTEHAVCFVDDVSTVDVAEIGRRIRSHPSLGEMGANVDFVEANPDTGVLHVRTFEKGVECETLACGTGAVASALVSIRRGYITSDVVAVEMAGGTLRVGVVTHEGVPTPTFLQGPATFVYRGTFEL